MKKVLLVILSVLMLAGTAYAQRDLNCYPVFQGEIVPLEKMVLTEIRGGHLTRYKLDYYRGASFQVGENLARKVAALVEADADAAGIRETEKVGTFLTYALVQPKSAGKLKRYLCYQARPVGDGWKLTVLYLEGSATLEDLRSMFEKQ